MCGGDSTSSLISLIAHHQFPGSEHSVTASAPARPSYCILPLFHAPRPLNQFPTDGLGYTSNDGHSFSCRNPAAMQQAFHVLVHSVLLCGIPCLSTLVADG